MYYKQERFQAIYDCISIKNMLYELSELNKIIRINYKSSDIYEINLKNEKCKIINKNINHTLIALETLKHVFETYEIDIKKNYELIKEIKDETLIKYQYIKNKIKIKKYELKELLELIKKLTEYIYKKYQEHNFCKR